MKMTFIVCNEYSLPRLMELLQESDIDYYTRWGDAQGKGHGTEPHLGTGSFGTINAVLMIAFEEEPPLSTLVSKIVDFNAEVQRAADRIRLFQMPLDRIV
jgi:hypothetical protein